MIETGLFMASDLACAVAAVGLEGSEQRFPSAPLDDHAWQSLLAQARFHRMTGLLAVATHEGRLPATARQLAEAYDAHASGMALCLHLDALLIAMTTHLEGSGVDSRVLKGSSFAHLDYPDPAWRAYADVDLLVRSDDFDAAVGALESAGYRRAYREVRTGFDHRFGKGASFSAPGRLQVDLHRTFVMGPFGLTIALDDLWADAARFRLGGRDIEALGSEVRFLHACYHAAIGNARTRLVPLRDLAGMLQREAPRLDLARVRSLARAWWGEPVLARAVRLAWDAFALPESSLSAWAGEFQPDRHQQRALRAYLDLDMGYAARSFTAIRVLPRWRDRVAFARALALPDRHFGAGRHGGRLRRWRHAARQIATLARRTRRGGDRR